MSVVETGRRAVNNSVICAVHTMWVRIPHTQPYLYFIGVPVVIKDTSFLHKWYNFAQKNDLFQIGLPKPRYNSAGECTYVPNNLCTAVRNVVFGMFRGVILLLSILLVFCVWFVCFLVLPIDLLVTMIGLIDDYTLIKTIETMSIAKLFLTMDAILLGIFIRALYKHKFPSNKKQPSIIWQYILDKKNKLCTKIDVEGYK